MTAEQDRPDTTARRVRMRFSGRERGTGNCLRVVRIKKPNVKKDHSSRSPYALGCWTRPTKTGNWNGHRLIAGSTYIDFILVESKK